jgi:hypothetical protein
VTAECDLLVGLHAKRWFDVVGHYSREEVLAPATPGVPFGPSSAGRLSLDDEPG